ncbi:MAG: hypothetical protein AUI14_08990 [Actinobacteria bacterium 13_2_20CM_2_71_6]|nr:MAG: hypothetical protein AUI14_08990 [Actinobacteria bacterium 13_2_20CM_2_71_6]
MISVLFGLIGSTAIAAATTPSFADSTGTKTVSYLGHRFTVPAGWAVVDLTAAPQTCVRFDRHVVYLGTPDQYQNCPAHVVGISEALLMAPAPATGAPPQTAEDPGEHELIVTGSGFTVTATYRADRPLIQRILASAGLPQTGTTMAPARPPTAASAAALAGSAATNYTGKGFEACDTPSLSTMSAWGSSPYRGVGMYFGGVNRSCKAQPNLTSTWVSRQAAAGWHFLPIYVGLQVANDSCSGCALIGSPTSDGTSAADDAANRAAALGFGPGTVLYFDMESYALTASHSSVALAFEAAWTRELHARGFNSGYYSSGSTGITDLVNHYSTNTMPDVIDVANYNGKATTTDPYVPSGMWANHERLHQYQGDHNETWGGVTINIDLDYYDVQLGGAPADDAAMSAVANPATSNMEVYFNSGGALTENFWNASRGWSGPFAIGGTITP